MKLLTNKGVAEDMYDLCASLSKGYSKAVAYNQQKLALKDLLEGISSEPLKFQLMTDEANLKKSRLRDVKSEFENSTPTENRVSMKNEISSRECNLEISLKLEPNDFKNEGVTFFSECFYSFSATWNLKIDISKDGTVSVYLIERAFKKPDEGTHNELVVFGHHNNVVPMGISARKLIDNGRNSIFPLNFKSVLFNVSVVDTRFSKEFKIFYSFSKDQNQIIGCENFFNMTQLSTHDMIHLKVRVAEDILHSAVMHYLASNFYTIAKEEVRNDPEAEKRVSYCMLKKLSDRYSDDSRHNSVERKTRDLFDRHDRHRHDEYHRHGDRRRPGTPPSELKRNMRFDPRDQYRIIDNKSKSRDMHKSNRSYVNLPYYDLSFLLESDYLNIEKEYTALDAAYRYGVKVLDDPEVINRLIRAIRFNYLELNDLL